MGDAEGAFYIWDKSEIDEALGGDAEVVAYFFGVKENGNVSAKHDMHGEMTGKVICIIRIVLMDGRISYVKRILQVTRLAISG